jgi:hypothetical protein
MIELVLVHKLDLKKLAITKDLNRLYVGALYKDYYVKHRLPYFVWRQVPLKSKQRYVQLHV